jgi:TPR repeat protein
MTENDNQGSPKDVWQQARLAADEGDHRTVLRLLKQLDCIGVSHATARIGEFYELGAIGIEKDVEEAARWYRKAVLESDDPIAHLGLGRIYYEGSPTVMRNLQSAREHLMKAYDGEVYQAGIYLGQMSMFGVGVKRDLIEADRFFMVAAARGFPIAYTYSANVAAMSGKLVRTVRMLTRGLFLTAKLKMRDRNHPNLWKPR